MSISVNQAAAEKIAESVADWLRFFHPEIKLEHRDIRKLTEEWVQPAVDEAFPTAPAGRLPEGAFIDDLDSSSPLRTQETVYWMCREKGIRYDDHDIGHILRTAAPLLRQR